MRKSRSIPVFSCEHATNHVPPEFRYLFRNAEDILQSHRGWDPGSFSLGQAFRRQLGVTLFQAKATRLLVEPNRSLGHRSLFSEFTNRLDTETKFSILERFYHSHRGRIQMHIGNHIASHERVIHLSIHTFTPVLDGIVRQADVGLLYDSRRPTEAAFCEAWRAELAPHSAELRIRKNYPYLGKADGFTTDLRRRFPAGAYLGIELEVNQKWLASPAHWRRLTKQLVSSFQVVLNRGV